MSFNKTKFENFEANEQTTNLNIIAHLQAIKECLAQITAKIDGKITEQEVINNIDKRINEYINDYHGSNEEKMNKTHLSSEFDFLKK